MSFRKTFVAIATASAVALSGTANAVAQNTTTTAPTSAQPTTTAPTSAQPTTTAPAPVTVTETTTQVVRATTTPTTPNTGSSGMTPSEIRDWIAVFTALIGALSAAYTFINRYVA